MRRLGVTMLIHPMPRFYPPLTPIYPSPPPLHTKKTLPRFALVRQITHICPAQADIVHTHL